MGKKEIGTCSDFPGPYTIQGLALRSLFFLPIGPRALTVVDLAGKMGGENLGTESGSGIRQFPPVEDKIAERSDGGV